MIYGDPGWGRVRKRFESIEEYLDWADEHDRWWERYKVDWPEMDSDHWRIRHFEIGRLDPGRIVYLTKEGLDRDPGWGSFTTIQQLDPATGRWSLWMSDTKAEIKEHSPLFTMLNWSFGDQTVLINGLGLGMAVKAALLYDQVQHIDVVEINAELAELMRPMFPADRVTIHVGDAHTIRWPKGTSWSIAWHDIWDSISAADIPSMQRLHRRYGGRTGVQDSWQREGRLMMRRKDEEFRDALERRDWARVRQLDPHF